MIFRNLYTERFRNLPDRCWGFLPGLQLVRGPNEAGKTSMRYALTLALFGDASTTDHSVLALCSWGNNGMRIELEFEHDTHTYRLVRDFEDRKNLLEIPAANKRWRNKEQIREQLARIIVIPNHKAFLATACMSQDELAIDNPAEVHRLIEHHVICGTGVDVDQLLGKLENARRARHKGENRPTREPGVFRSIQDALEQLQREWAEANQKIQQSEDAARELVGREIELAECEKRTELLKERLQRHEDFLRARKERGKLATELLQVEDFQKRAEALDTEILRLRGQLTAEQPAVERLQSAVRSAEERTRLGAELAGARTEARQRSAQCAAIVTQRTGLAALRAEEEGLPVRLDEAQNAFHRLPKEVSDLAQALERDRSEQERRRSEAQALAGQVIVIRTDLENLEQQRKTLESQRARSDSYELLRTRLAGAQEQQAELQKKMDRITALEEEIERLKADRRELPSEELSRLNTAIVELRSTLAGETIRLQIEPECSLEVQAELDGRPPVIFPVPGEQVFERRANIRIAGMARILVENRSRVAVDLVAREAELRTALEACGCQDWQQYQRLEQQHRVAAQEIIERQARRQAYLGDSKKRDLIAGQAELGRQIADLEGQLAQFGAEGPIPDRAEVGARLKHLEAQFQERNKEEAVVAAKLTALRGALVEGASMQQAQQELERKSQILAGILDRAGVGQPAELQPLLNIFARIERERVEAQDALASALAGCRVEDVQALLEENQQRIQQLEEALAAIPHPAWTTEELEARKQELNLAQECLEKLQDDLRLAEARRNALDTARLQERRDGIVVELAVARAAVEKNEPYQLEPNEALKIEREIPELQTKINKYREDVGTFRERERQREGLRERMLDAEEEMESLNRRLEIERSRDQVDADVRSLLAEARQTAVAELRNQVPELTARYLAIATAGRYNHLEGDGLIAGVFSPQKGDVLDDSEISSGTADQLYLAKRLAALTALFGKQLPPLLLDDILVHSDPERRAALLNLLREFAAESQVLLFTCQDYAEYAGLPAVDLGQPAGTS